MFRAVVCILLLVAIGLGGYAYVQHGRRKAVALPVAKQPKVPLAVSNQHRLDSAIELLKSGQQQQALAAIDRLAREEPPFIPAHRYLINRLIRSGKYRQDIDQLKTLTRHLNVVADSGDLSAKIALTQVLVAANMHDSAIKQLREVVQHRPGMNTLLARLLILQGKTEAATEAAEVAVEYFRMRVEAEPDNPKLRLAYADSLGILDRNEEAIAALKTHAGDFPELVKAMTEYAVRQADLLLRNDEAAYEAAGILGDALKDDPTSIAVWSRLYPLALQMGEAGRLANDMVAVASNEGTSMGMLELVRGADAFSKGDHSAAIGDLERAHGLSPDNVEIVKTLAWYLAHDDPPQFDRALQLVSQLVELHPQQLEFLETRGQILALMNRDQEAIEDLRTALRVMPTHPPLIKTLASLYEKQGNTARATALREHVVDISTEPDASKRPFAREMVDELLKTATPGKPTSQHSAAETTEVDVANQEGP